MNPDPAILDELVRRTVQAVDPVRIILFGSAARGKMGPNSDLDILVVITRRLRPRGRHANPALQAEQSGARQ